MKKQTITTISEKETHSFGEKLSHELKGGEVLLLEGNLGAGKSVLVRGIAKGLGITKRITSPTFVLMKIYDVPDYCGIKHFVHVDAYRVTAKDLMQVGLGEYLGRKDCVVAVEWGKKLATMVPKQLGAHISVSLTSNGDRTILIHNM